MKPYDIVIARPPFWVDLMMENGIHIITSYRPAKVSNMYDWIMLWAWIFLSSKKHSPLLN